ncbi:M48 family metalloprotease [Variovorax sp. PAMC 28711]|uniref:M48 family metalloprotease n=1 Tax=Variovorax sp. PAMC 28711 TaxID=1795631 RepID=UPI00078BECCB|nr:M48 family metalloprotease [Variovorax sp. PAMC 28711]AMM24851.1 peptidase M48 [Variovorax sp. PAMC 28711]
MPRLTPISKPEKWVAMPALRALCATLLIACQVLTPTAARAQLLPGLGDGGEMTASAERRLGDQIARELYRDTDYIDDPVIVEYTQEIWQKLLAAARVRGDLTPELDERFAWQVLLGRDSSINAFALPGGYLGLHLGLIAVIGSRDELATVLGHELSHVTQRHIARMMDRNAKNTPLMLAAMVLGLLAAAKSKSGDAGQAVLMGSQAYAMQSQLSFSRDMEREADRVGFGVMTQAGYDPRGAASMFEKLQYAARLNDNSSYPYLRSHPMNTERIADMQGRFQFRNTSADANADASVAGTAAAPPVMPLAMDHAMIASRARVLTRPGSDTLRQWVEAGSSGEAAKAPPAPQAGMLYAAALSASALRDFKAARALVERLTARTANDPAASRLARLLSAEIELAAGNPAKAASLLNLKAKDRPEMLLATQAAIATGNAAPMRAPLRDWTATHPRDATAWRALGSVYGAEGDPVQAIAADAEANVAILDYPGARDRYKAAQELSRKLSAEGKPVDHYAASIIDTRARAIDGLVRQQAEEPPLK